MTTPDLILRLHHALAAHPAPIILTYEEQVPDGQVDRLVTETTLYEPGPMRDWMLAFGRAVVEGNMRHNIGTWSGPGILLLVDGKWLHVDPSRMTPEEAAILEARSSACVGRDNPMINIQRVDPKQ